MIVRVAVDVGSYAIDRLYDYAVPEALSASLLPGVRVSVPFGRGNRREEGIIVALAEGSEYKKLKCVDSALDTSPVLSADMLKLAVHLRERLMCTFYSLVRVMLPAGLWFRREVMYSPTPDFTRETALLRGIGTLYERFAKDPSPVNARKLRSWTGAGFDLPGAVMDGLLIKSEGFRPAAAAKTDQVYALTDAGEGVMSDGKCTLKGAVRCEVVEFLSRTERAAMNEIEYYTGASRATVAALLRDGYIEKQTRRVLRRPETDVYIGREIRLNDAQYAAAQGISALMDGGRYAPSLLFGVTGSGKTEVYITLIAKALSQGKGVIVLVPEIALTPQMTARFYHEFGDEIAVIHSALSIGERFDEWERIKNGDIHVVVGTRSAVFSPVQNLGLIIIDEEHEHTFRSERDPRYHARDVAKYRCRTANAALVLGSATPSIDSAHAAKLSEYAYFELTIRAVPVGLPAVTVSDKRESFRAGYAGCIGAELSEMITATLNAGEQAILFLNRRGSSKSVSCMACGFVPHCINCSTALAYHRENDRLLCHQCGYSIKMPNVCPACGSKYLEQIGFGTQTLEEELNTRFPSARVIRMDSDTTAVRGAHMELLGRFAAGDADILIGTQMIAKGLNFPNVTLSAVVDADMGLYTGDFRSSERTFSLITQVAGRSGRAEKPGFAVIQTVSPENDVILSAAKQDYWEFYGGEIAIRQAMNLPPFCRMAQITVASPIEDMARKSVRRLAARIAELIAQSAPFGDMGMSLLGPTEAPIFKLANRYRYTLTLRFTDSRRQREFLSGVLLEFSRAKENRGAAVYCDINL
jgi:primosomal protein N' (replication factor Y)